MRNRILILVSLLALCLTQVTLLHAVEKKQRVTLTGDPRPPYIIGEVGKEATAGVGVDLMHAIFEQLDGVELSIPLLPWKRALREVRRGTKDGIGILLKTPRREEYMDYTDELFRSYNTVWYAASNFPNGFEWQQYADFKPYRIGVVRDHTYGDEFDQMIDTGSLTVIKVSSVRRVFTMLEKGRIELAIADRLVGAAFVKKYAASKRRFVVAKKPAAGEVYYIAFSKKSEARHLIPAVNRVVAELKKEGVIQKLVNSTE